MGKLALCLALSLTGIAHAHTADQTIEVKSFQVVGDIANLTEAQQLALAAALRPYQNAAQSIEGLHHAKTAAENALAESGAGKYRVDLPVQEISEGNVYLQLRLGAQPKQTVYKGSKGYDADNVKRSLPSLAQGKELDPRELHMAQENPLKATRVHYDIDAATGEKGTAVAAYAPFGNTRSYVGLDNYGSREFNYFRATAGHINANLTGNDDVLSISAMTNLKNPAKSFAIGADYQRPLYNSHQIIGANIGFSNLDSTTGSDALPQGLNQRTAKGRNLNAGLRYSYLLPRFDLGFDNQLKFNAGYELRHINQRFAIDANNNALTISDAARYSIAGIYAGISGETKPAQGSEINFGVHHHFYSKHLPGSSRMQHASAFADKAHSYGITRYNLGIKQKLADWQLSTELRGQHSSKALASVEQESITGAYNVRGFRYAGISGDNSLVWKTEIATPRYTEAQLGGYVFYDWGRISSNSAGEAARAASSAGIGIRARAGLDFDLAVVRRGKNYDADRLPNGDQSGRTSAWLKATYFF